MDRRGGPRVSFGPSWIALLTEVDTASIVTGLQVGAAQGCLMALAALALAVPLFFVHEVAGSMGPASGMGLGGALRKLFGARAAYAFALLMSLSDVVGYAAQYAGIALALRMMGLPVVPGLLAALLATVAIARRSGSWHLRAALLVLSAFLVGTVMASAAGSFTLLARSCASGGPRPGAQFYFMLAALAGATISPWSIAFHSGARRIRAETRALRAEVLAGSLASQAIIAMAIITGAALGGTLSPGNLAGALRPLGHVAPYVLGAGFIGGSLLALAAISLSSTWRTIGVLGARRGAAVFELTPVIEGGAAMAVVVIAGNPIDLMVDLMVAVTLMLLPQLYLLGRVASEEIMGQHRLRGLRALAYWLSSAFIALSGALAVAMTVNYPALAAGLPASWPRPAR
ncbi:MAG: divalent metal cation transporter [Nitrososphaeria archaeon]